MSTASSDTETRVRKIIADHLCEPAESVLPETKFEDLGTDSLDMVDLLLAVEEDFDIVIDEATLDGLTTVGEAVALVERVRGAAGEE